MTEENTKFYKLVSKNCQRYVLLILNHIAPQLVEKLPQELKDACVLKVLRNLPRAAKKTLKKLRKKRKPKQVERSIDDLLDN